ncbi:hypothetical protein T440DRAFT_386476 [Plenodomus tracheiphilus IPT5]|uniref:Iron reductase domain protein n=1 Tax=Plenodomus tracheiphilus IPT5 TaxID=1408161 RepID=A0A6A7BJL0_9PLEO|nr:hypothetical protein T440DRAFT_386476 [Plenodomus tracheiphilus IPT5]
MHFLALALTVFTAATVALPSSPAPAYDLPSDGFHLIIQSDDPGIDGTGSYNADNIGGSLIFILEIGGGQSVPSAMRFSARSDTNTQDMTFAPGEGDGSSHVQFDESGNMSRNWVDSKWYLCGTTSGYPMNLLVWVDGDTPTAQDPACQQVRIQRVWA